MWNVFCWTSCIYRVFKKCQNVFQGYISGNMKLNQFVYCEYAIRSALLFPFGRYTFQPAGSMGQFRAAR